MPSKYKVESDASDAARARITRSEAAAYRPSLEDPTRLANGHFHPRYGDWLGRPGDETNPWLYVTFELLVERLPHTADDKLDATAVKAALGPRWNDIIGGKHLGAKAPTWTRLARLIALTDTQMMEHVERARSAEAEKAAMVRRCRNHPFRLQDWDQVSALEPCPGCGHPWLEPDSEQATIEYQSAHKDCLAGGTAFAGSRRHCNRCCGVPPMSPDACERVDDLLASAQRSRAAQEEATQARERAERDAPTRVARRAAEIIALEKKLESLRRKQAYDERQLTDLPPPGP